MPGAEIDYADDAALVAALRAGDERAFVWLLDRYSAPLERLALSYVGTPAAAAEVVQDAWLGVIKGIDRFEGRSSLKTWIYRILVNLARSKGVREHRAVPFASLHSELDAADPAVGPERFQGTDGRWPGHWAAPPVAWDEKPEDRALHGELLGVVAAAIGALPPSQRTVITLRDVDGLDASEVCSTLEISEGNQRVLLHRARSRVRRAVELHYEDVP